MLHARGSIWWEAAVGAAAFAVVLLGVLLLRNVGPFASSDQRSGDTTGHVFEAAAGPGGVRVVVDGIVELAGVEILVPQGAVAQETTLRVSYATDLAASQPLALAREDLAWNSAIHDAALDSGLPPTLLAGLIATGASPSGVALRLEPAGTTFATPVQVTAPLALLGVTGNPDLLVMLQDDAGRWQVLPATVDPVAGALSFEIEHFSLVGIWHWSVDVALVPVDALAARLGAETLARYVRNVLHNPAMSFDREQFSAAYRRISGTDEWEFFEAVYCSGIAPRTAPTAIPDLTTLAMSLGFESQRVQSSGYQLETQLTEWIAQRDTLTRELAASGKNGVVPALPPADVFGKAYTLAEGDVFTALAVVHNVLRDNRNRPTVHSGLYDIRPSGIDELEQNGARYHLFGTALYGFGFAYWQAQGGSPGIDWDPGTLSRIEEAWISGDIRTDVMEFAVDAHGGVLGRGLYRFLSRVEAGDPEYVLDNFFKRADCGVMEARGPFIDPAEAEASAAEFGTTAVGVNELEIRFSTETGELTGTAMVDQEFPLGVLLLLAGGIGDIIGEALCEAATLGTADCVEDDEADPAATMPAELADCVLIFHATAKITGFYLPADATIWAKFEPAIAVDVEGACADQEEIVAAVAEVETAMAEDSGEPTFIHGAYDAKVQELTVEDAAAVSASPRDIVLPVTVADAPQ